MKPLPFIVCQAPRMFPPPVFAHVFCRLTQAHLEALRKLTFATNPRRGLK